MTHCESKISFTSSGNVTCSIANTDIGTCSVDNSKKIITVKAKKRGTTTITFTIAASSSYGAGSKTLTFKGGLWSYGGSFSDTTDCIRGCVGNIDGSQACDSSAYSYSCRSSGASANSQVGNDGGTCWCHYMG